MIVQIFEKKNRNINSAKQAVDYLLGKDRDREKARLLQGDPDLSVKIAQSLEFKNAYTVGCLSFEEENIPEEQKQEIMHCFEDNFLPMEKDKYNILWVEHRDKNRLELNFFIPNVELETGKRLQPYYHKADLALADSFKIVINREYGLSDPDDPNKKQNFKINKNIPTDKKNDIKEIEGIIQSYVETGRINNRSDVVAVLNDMGLEVARETKSSISIRDGNRNIRLKGAYFEREFDAKRANSTRQATSPERSRDNNERYQRAVITLQQRRTKRAEQFATKYQRKNTRDGCNVRENGLYDSRNRSENLQRSNREIDRNINDTNRGADEEISTRASETAQSNTQHNQQCSYENSYLSDDCDSKHFSDSNNSDVDLSECAEEREERITRTNQNIPGIHGRSEYSYMSDGGQQATLLRGSSRAIQESDLRRQERGLLRDTARNSAETEQKRQIEDGNANRTNFVERIREYYERARAIYSELKDRFKQFRTQYSDIDEEVRRVDRATRATRSINEQLSATSRRVEQTVDNVTAVNQQIAHRQQVQAQRESQYYNNSRDDDMSIGY